MLGAAFGPTEANAQAATDRYVVTFKPGAAAGARAAVAAIGGRVDVDLDWVDAIAVTLPAHAVAGLSRHPAVEFIEADPMRHAMRVPGYSTQDVSTQWERNPYGIAMVQANLVTYNPAGGRTLCIIDSGYNLGHEDLQSSNVSGVNLTRSGDWSTDENSHGTHVAGTVAALFNGKGVVGVVPTGGLNLYIAKVFDASGSAPSSVIMRAVRACAKAGASVISMSLGGGAPTRSEQRAYDSIAASNILVVAAAGNGGDETISYPAGYPSVMSVAAVDQFMNRASFSQFNSDVEIAGPGVGVESTVPMGTGRQVSLAVGGAPFQAFPMEGSPTTTTPVSGPLYNFGRGTATDGGASGKVCLIERGDISFAEKVSNCQASGGVGAVIYNNVAGNFNGTLGATVTNIPSLSISQADGTTLLGLLGQSTTISVTAANYAFFDGTSMATPHVSGVAALVWSNHPGCTAAQLRTSLNLSALDLGDAERDVNFGYGLVQARAAFDRIASLGCGN